MANPQKPNTTNPNRQNPQKGGKQQYVKGTPNTGSNRQQQNTGSSWE